MNYGRGLLVARTRAGLSQRQLALKAKLSPSYLAHIEAGRRKPSLDALEALAEALGVPIPVLLLGAADDADLKGISAAEAAILTERLQVLLR